MLTDPHVGLYAMMSLMMTIDDVENDDEVARAAGFT
jgi:hypothetical protein